ncbi:MAG: SDR family oxidoreductase [Verrucomicrobiales bacterium]|nr:SDR family oxidoreductase [Verrucomicrobiales bacterium]
MSTLADKVAIVTGAGSGIGRAIAETFAAHGARVAVLDYDESAGAETAALIQAAGGVAAFERCDVSSQDSVRAAVRDTLGRHGRIDILVNNAGVAHIGTAASTSEADFDRVFGVNVKGVYNCLHVVIPHLLEAGGGVILNLSSVAAVTGLPDRFAYSASKGAVHTMTFSVATDYIDRNIRCNCLCPARVHTPFVDGYLARNYPGQEAAMFEKLSKAQPIGRMASPSEIADLALYLCSDAASFITGTAWPIDGGYLNVRK